MKLDNVMNKYEVIAIVGEGESLIRERTKTKTKKTIITVFDDIRDLPRYNVNDRALAEQFLVLTCLELKIA